MYNRLQKLSYKAIILKATSYINDAFKTNNLQSIKHYDILRRYNCSMPQYRNFMRKLCDAA